MADMPYSQGLAAAPLAAWAAFVKAIAFRLVRFGPLFAIVYSAPDSPIKEARGITVNQDLVCARRRVISVTSGGQLSRTGSPIVPTPMVV